MFGCFFHIIQYYCHCYTGDDGVKFIRSQKKYAQLVYNGYIYNKKLTQANGQTTWRCIDLLKLRCKAVVITKKNKLVAARRSHNHEDHVQRIGQRPLYKVEEDLSEYIEIKPEDPKLADFMNVSNIEICTQKSGKEFKLFVPTPAVRAATTIWSNYQQE